MALTMADFIEKKGLGQDVDASQVNLSANDLARLGRIQGLDTRSGYGGLGIQQAQELTSELPQAADLGLVVEQNKQLQAAGGRGYAGNVHNLQGDQTPFEKLTQSIAASQVPDRGGMPQEQIGLRGDGNGGSGGIGGGDLGTLGHFGQEAFSDVVGTTGVKGLTSAGLAYGMGAPLGLATKFGISSMFSPVGALLGMGRMAYGSALDMSASQEMADMGIDSSAVDQEAVNDAVAAGAQARALGLHQADAYAGLDPGVSEAAAVQDRISNAGIIDNLGRAFSAIARGPKGGWTASTNIDKELGVHKGTLANDPMGMMAGVRGLSSSFGSNDGGSDRGGYGRSDGFGDRESSGGYGGMGGI